MIVTYPELVGAMAKRKLTKTEVARKIGISPRTLYSKLNGVTEFTLSEANAIHKAFFPDMDKETLFSTTEDIRPGAPAEEIQDSA